MRLPAFLVAALLALTAIPSNAQNVTTENIDGVVNFKRVETTVACGGSTAPEALAAMKKMGFVSVFNLRLPNEQGNDVAKEEAAAKAAGLKFVNLPLDANAPDAKVADKFLEFMKTPGYQPAFIHCARGGRAAAMWMVKRLVMDKWDAKKAQEEATALGLSHEGLTKFVLAYAAAHK